MTVRAMVSAQHNVRLNIQALRARGHIHHVRHCLLVADSVALELERRWLRNCSTYPWPQIRNDGSLYAPLHAEAWRAFVGAP